MEPFVYLIGAGPGDPGLLTLRGADCLARSEVVLYDGLSNADLLRHAPDAEHICVGKHGQTRIWNQREIIEEMLRHANSGKVVARLKGGDPAVFARTAEEVDALRESGIPFEIVPGITAALAAGSYAGLPVTHRKLASAVALVTGHEEPGKPESALDWQALARFPGTLVIYMGVTTAKTWTAALIDGGQDPATPVALVRRCSMPDQAMIRCRLDEAAEQLTPASRFRPPVIAIVGPVAGLAESETWLQTRPLSGLSVLVTRPARQAKQVADLVAQLGGTPIIAPAIDIREASDHDQLDASIERLPNTDFLIFCSTNAVEFYFERLNRLGHDSRRLAGISIATIGRKTASVLQKHGLKADVVPTDYRASSLVEALSGQVTGRSVSIIRASRGSRELPEGLEAAGASVHETAAYENVDIEEADARVVSALETGTIDWITVTSSATARNLFRLYGDLLKNARLAAISPVTAESLRELGLTVDVVADPYTIESLLTAIAENK